MRILRLWVLDLINFTRNEVHDLNKIVQNLNKWNAIPKKYTTETPAICLTLCQIYKA
jgi:hypothetical protein